MSKVIVGIDLGGTYIKSAVVTRDKQILGQESRPTESQRGPEGVMDTMAAGAEAALKAAGVSKRDVLAAGAGSPGPLNWQTGIVYETPNLPGWSNVPLADGMTRRLGVPCFVDNDANAACYGEFWLGAGQGADNMCLLTLGTGVGGGVVCHGKLLRGIDGTAAELGHMKVQRDGRLCGCGARGCLEAYAAVPGMIRTATELIEAGESSLLTELSGGDPDRITGKMISEAAAQGDAVAQKALHETAVWLGIGIASLINIFNPEKIVLCGGMIAAGEALFGPIRATAAELAFAVPAQRAQILPAGLGADSGVIGAAGCALERYESAGGR